MRDQLEAAASGECFVIAQAGKPMVKVTAMDAPPPTRTRRIGLLIGQIAVRDDFDEMGRDPIERLFGDA